MRVLLANLPWFINNRYGVRAGSRWPFTSFPEKDGKIHYIPFPFFLAYATSLLKQKGKTAELIDAIAEGLTEEEFIKKAIAYNPDLIVVETSTPSLNNDLAIAKSLKNTLANLKIIFCGPHPSVYPSQILKDNKFIHYIMVGEYEYTLLELMDSLEKGLNLNSVLGLAYRDSDNIKVNRRRSTINDLDGLPWPYRDRLTIYRYNDGFADLPLPNVQIWASRGCPYQCTFCLWPQVIYNEHKYRKRNPKNVVDEMEYLIKNFGFKAVYFDDDIFNAEKKQVLAICDEITRRNIKIPWAIMGITSLMDKELLTELARAGLYAIKYGVESADSEILASCQKSIDLEKSKQIINITKQLGIKVHLAFCVGLPGETRNTVQKTVDFIHNIRPDSLQISLATPFPGTEYFNYSKKNNWLLSEDWDNFDGNYKANINSDELKAEELDQIIVNLRKEFKL
ncbi:MAG: radical SAM protein [Candidatus Omnitrophica bacterium]|jgi:radical SAM superfamily enzyme YgiQ (UPF0313 family)|nr:radical SAM protein [Candidatus Omnitrophota bacterium]